MKALEEKQALKSGMAAKVRNEQMKTAVAGLRLEMAELKDKQKANIDADELRHEQYMAALKELQPTVDSFNELALSIADKSREMEQQSAQLFSQADSEAQSRVLLFKVWIHLFELISHIIWP